MTHLNEFLAAVEKRERAATPGPWHWKCAYEFHTHEDTGLDTDCDNIDSGRITLEPGVLCEWAQHADDSGVSVTRDDAEFIAHSRQDVKALLEIVRKLEGLVYSPEYDAYRENKLKEIENIAKEAMGVK